MASCRGLLLTILQASLIHALPRRHNAFSESDTLQQESFNAAQRLQESDITTTGIIQGTLTFSSTLPCTDSSTVPVLPSSTMSIPLPMVVSSASPSTSLVVAAADTVVPSSSVVASPQTSPATSQMPLPTSTALPSTSITPGNIFTPSSSAASPSISSSSAIAPVETPSSTIQSPAVVPSSQTSLYTAPSPSATSTAAQSILSTSEVVYTQVTSVATSSIVYSAPSSPSQVIVGSSTAVIVNAQPTSAAPVPTYTPQSSLPAISSSTSTPILSSSTVAIVPVASIIPASSESTTSSRPGYSVTSVGSPEVSTESSSTHLSLATSSTVVIPPARSSEAVTSTAQRQVSSTVTVVQQVTSPVEPAWESSSEVTPPSVAQTTSLPAQSSSSAFNFSSAPAIQSAHASAAPGQPWPLSSVEFTPAESAAPAIQPAQPWPSSSVTSTPAESAAPAVVVPQSPHAATPAPWDVPSSTAKWPAVAPGPEVPAPTVGAATSHAIAFSTQGRQGSLLTYASPVTPAEQPPTTPCYTTSLRYVTITIDETKTVTRCYTSIWQISTGESSPPHATLTVSTQERSQSGWPSLAASSNTASIAEASAVNVPAIPSASNVVPTFTHATITQTLAETSAGSVLVETTTLTISLRTTLTTSAIQTVTVTEIPNTTGSIHTSLQSGGRPSTQPFNATVIPTPLTSITPLRTGTAVISSSTTVSPSLMVSPNIFQPVASGAPPSQISSRANHPVPRLGINNAGPIETNKFYSNFFLGTRTGPTLTFPYTVSWAAGQGITGSWGIAVQHIERSQTTFGPGSPASYYVNPNGLQSIILSARQLGSGTSLTMTNIDGLSADVNLAPSSGAAPMITFHLVQGMGFTTGVYTNGIPLFQSSIFFSSLTYGGVVSGSSTVRYTTKLMDGNTWFIYMTPASGSSVPTLTLASPQQIIGDHVFSGTIQVAKLPFNLNMASAQIIYDASAGVYATKAMVTGTAKGADGSYTLSWPKAGLVAKHLLMFALPHHVAAFDSNAKVATQNNLQLQTTTKGIAIAVVADSWTMLESLATSIDLAPWSPKLGSQTHLPAAAVSLINSVAAGELAEDIEAQTDLNSMYYAGKALAKFAQIVYTTNTLGNATGVASAGLVKLKLQYSRFVNNTQIFPLVYDSSWGGIVSSASYVTGDPGVDFGNSYYNDHHFHYGYFVYAAAVIGRLDPSWLQQGSNKAWVQTLVRDYANAVSDDGYTPFSRMFDWFHGHSWASGIFESFDGKNQESSSEDAFASYALKMWGRTIGDQNMEARGTLMLAVQARSLTDYYLMQSTNTIQPPQSIANKAAGILFENKVDHTTYFGTNIEYIEGIHMLPLNPSSALTRNSTFVTQEWDTYFSNGRVDAIDSGWKGILYANLALIDPRTAYQFFAQSNFQPQWLDGGASRTWYLAYCAGLGGAS